MRLLIADLVRRNRWNAAFFGVVLALMFRTSAATGNAVFAFEASMGLAFGLGPTMTLRFTPRPIWYLPIAKRDLWRAGWLVAIVGVLLLTTAVKLAAIVLLPMGHAIGLADIVLSSTYDCACAGVGCGLVILASRPRPTSGPWRWVSGLLGTLASFGLAFGLPLAVCGTLVFGHALPTHWTDLTPRSIAVLVAALSLTVATYFHSPAPPGLASHPFFERTPVKRGPPRFELVRLSGLPRLLVHEAAWTLMITGCLVAGSVLFVIVAAGLAQSPEGLAELLRSVLLRLDGSVPRARASGIESFVLLFVFAIFSGSITGRFPTMIRHLRVLPVGTARLNALLIAWPAATWLTAWTIVLALHVLVLGRGLAAHHLDALLALMGVSAIVQATTLWFSGFLRVLVFVPLTLIVPLVLFLDVPSPATFVVVGLGGLAGAIGLNHRSLARRSTYTASGPMAGGGKVF